MTNGVIPICVKILMDDQKYKKEVRIWALVTLNRGSFHISNNIGDKMIKTCL